MKVDRRTVDHIISTRNVTSNKKIIENLEQSRKSSTKNCSFEEENRPVGLVEWTTYGRIIPSSRA